MLANQVLSDIGIKNLSLEINSIGCPTCRAEYHKALKAYFADNSDELCGTCKDRLERNPMRILDCKSPVCKGIAEGAPVVLDFLCDECKEHHAQLQAHLDAAGLKYTVNPQIVRGLDYYTKTVFEFVSGDIGAQSTVCGGGRYDGLIAQLGGPAVQSVGFAMGLERLMMVLTAQNAEFPPVASCDIYFVPMNSDAQIYATKLCSDLRSEGFEALSDINGRGMRAQLKYANKIGAKFTCVLGDDEINGDTLRIKNMASGEETEVKKNSLVDEFYSLINTLALDNLTDSVF